MKVTTEFLANSFKVFNELYFNGELVTPIFEVSHTKSALGDFRACNGFVYKPFRIRVSDFYVREQKEIEQTLLHEMIHQYQKQICNDRGHGRIFKKKADEINRKGGYSISRTTIVDNCQTKSSNSFKEYNVAVYGTNKGRWFLFVMASNKIDDWKRTLEASIEIQTFFIFKSKAEKYDSYPSCRKVCRGHYISKEEAINLQAQYDCKVFEKLTARRKAV